MQSPQCSCETPQRLLHRILSLAFTHGNGEASRAKPSIASNARQGAEYYADKPCAPFIDARVYLPDSSGTVNSGSRVLHHARGNVVYGFRRQKRGLNVKESAFLGASIQIFANLDSLPSCHCLSRLFL